MAQPFHFEINGAIYFITTRLKDIGFFLNKNEIEVIVETIRGLASSREMRLYAYVVMPNHFHVLIKPLRSEISLLMQLIKGRSSRRINKGNLWQKGFFDFTIMTEEKFREKFNYIHYNPVKSGLVEKAEDYKFSSALWYKVKYGEAFYQ